MEGLFFYWLAWIAWTWSTFFMNRKHPARLKISAWILAAIFAASYTFKLFIFDINLSSFIIILFLFTETQRKKTGAFLYLFFSSFIMMLAYTSFLMFELFDPVWVIFDRKILLAVMGIFVAVLLNNRDDDRLLILVSGFLQGEIAFSLIVWKFNFPYVIGSTAFLDALAVSMAVMIAWSASKWVITAISRSSVTHAEGEEQKTS